MNQENLKRVITLRHQLHAHPELSYEEHWTKATLMEFIEEHTNLELYDRGKYFYAVHRSHQKTKKAIAFRADFDALPIDDQIDQPYKSEIPGVGHKCGHDGHAATLCGLALEVDGIEFERDIYLIFQHAEETGQGAIEAKDCLADNDEIAEIYAFHNQVGNETGEVILRKWTSNCASKGMTIKMIGSPAHASLPEEGKNPVFPFANMVSRIAEISNPAKYKGITLCTIVQLNVGEYTFGIAANSGVLRMTIRGEYEEEMNKMRDELMKASLEEAEKAKVSCEFSFEDEFPETINDISCAEKVMNAANLLGYKTVEKKDGPYRGSEDFGHFLKIIPGALFFIGNGIDCPSFHTVTYDFNDKVIPYAVEMFKKLVAL